MESEEITQNNADKKIQRINNSEELDSKFGFHRHRTTTERVGWLINFQPVCFDKFFIFKYKIVEFNSI
jgi:hypothetical protein